MRSVFHRLHTPARLVLQAAILSFVLAAGAGAQMRTIPPDAARGFIRHFQEMMVTIDGAPMRLAPGASIRDRQNLIIMPETLPREGAQAAYLLDANGQISRVWLLGPEDAAIARPGP
jgi:hypothetical protein